MSRPPAASPALDWLTEASALLDRLGRTQATAIETASDWCAETIAAGGLVHLFGTGHSRIPVEEMFPRYGSYPGFNPMVELSMTFHTQVVGSNGQRQAMFIERMPGLAEVILANFRFGPRDILMVFSVGGRTAVPVEMARGARRRGLRVIAVTSVAQSSDGPLDEGVGSRLMDEADLVIDLCTPPADALCSIDGLDTPVGPGSSVAAIAIVNSIKVRTAHLLAERGALPPVITRASVIGAERSRASFDQAYAEHARRIARVLAGEGNDPTTHAEEVSRS
jgi:uncharacterized phosphosugar-binding protein